MPLVNRNPNSVGMIPSIFVKADNGRRYLVRFDWEWTVKKDSLGRKIRGTACPVKLHGVIVSNTDKSNPMVFPPKTSSHEAVRQYILHNENAQI